MAAAASFTFDQVPPFRPALADLGGADYEDDAAFPPDPDTMPNAAEHNERARNQAALNRVAPIALISIAFSGGTPSVQACSGMPTAVVSGLFTVTDNGGGDTSIEWPADTFPSALVPATAALVADFDGTICAYAITNGVRVKTRARSSGTGTDANFVVSIH